MKQGVAVLWMTGRYHSVFSFKTFGPEVCRWLSPPYTFLCGWDSILTLRSLRSAEMYFMRIVTVFIILIHITWFISRWGTEVLTLVQSESQYTPPPITGHSGCNGMLLGLSAAGTLLTHDVTPAAVQTVREHNLNPTDQCQWVLT